MSMLTSAAITTILPIKDMNRARDCFQEKRGLEPKGFAADGNRLFTCGGDAHISLIMKPEGTKSEHTALCFEVKGIGCVIEELKTKGYCSNTTTFRGSGRSTTLVFWDRTRQRG